jgi:hypothetical protein
MGIDLYLRWLGQTPEELAAQEAAWLIGTSWHSRRGRSGRQASTARLWWSAERAGWRRPAHARRWPLGPESEPLLATLEVTVIGQLDRIDLDPHSVERWSGLKLPSACMVAFNHCVRSSQT